LLDLQERLILVPTGILPEITDCLTLFTESLSEIAANTLANVLLAYNFYKFC
jgi:hypothetical protein